MFSGFTFLLFWKNTPDVLYLPQPWQLHQSRLPAQVLLGVDTQKAVTCIHNNFAFHSEPYTFRSL